jgi:hypothetical protein
VAAGSTPNSSEKQRQMTLKGTVPTVEDLQAVVTKLRDEMESLRQERSDEDSLVSPVEIILDSKADAPVNNGRLQETI